MRQLLFGIILFTLLPLGAQDYQKDRAAILEVMKQQEIAWSRHDLEGFMHGYWKNDSLKFFGSRGLTYGWQQTLNNYKEKYPTADETGTLNFSIEDLSRISEDSYWVMGRYHLIRKVGEAKGIFMIIFRRIKGEWKIVADISF